MAADDLRERIGSTVPPLGRRVLRGAARAVGRATSPIRVLPGFLIIGAQRAGTTTLYHYLRRHPQIAGAVWDKEIHFFDLAFDRGIGWYRSRFPSRFATGRILRRTGSPAIVGEASPYYLFHPLAPARVAATLPDAKLIALLRDPVERAWSEYRHEVDLGHETLSFEEALEREPERLAGEEERIVSESGYESYAHRHHSYLARGRYAEQLERWFACVRREQLLVIRAEDLFAQPAAGFADVLAFLGAAPWEPPSWRAHNVASAGEMSPATRERLRAYFRPYDERLAGLLGGDFGWDV